MSTATLPAQPDADAVLEVAELRTQPCNGDVDATELDGICWHRGWAHYPATLLDDIPARTTC